MLHLITLVFSTSQNDEAPTHDTNNYAESVGGGNPNGRPMNLQGVQSTMPMNNSR